MFELAFGQTELHRTAAAVQSARESLSHRKNKLEIQTVLPAQSQDGHRFRYEQSRIVVEQSLIVDFELGFWVLANSKLYETESLSGRTKFSAWRRIANTTI